MTKLVIDIKAAGFLKEILEKENVSAVRIFTGGGGCCKWFEISPAKKPLPGDATYEQDGIKVHIEKELVTCEEIIAIKFDEDNGLRIEFNEHETLNKINS